MASGRVVASSLEALLSLSSFSRPVTLRVEAQIVTLRTISIQVDGKHKVRTQCSNNLTRVTIRKSAVERKYVMKMFMVGGAVRDEILGVPSKDIDFTVVLEDGDFRMHRPGVTYLIPPNADPFKMMVRNLEFMGFEIFLESPEFLTVRARFPKKSVRMNADDALNRFQFAHPNLTADFVLARKESDYTDGRRPDVVMPGTLEDDLARRDFTMNAIAKDTDGTLIDPFNGVEDIGRRIIRAVGDPSLRMREDALRAVRALRFSVTKGFRIEGELQKVLLFDTAVFDMIADKISDERIQVELSKMFRFNTIKSLNVLSEYPALTSAMFAGSVSLDATMKTKGRGK